MKPFVLANAVEQGMNPFTTYYNSRSPIVIPMGYARGAVGRERRRAGRHGERGRCHQDLGQRRLRPALGRRRPGEDGGYRAPHGHHKRPAGGAFHHARHLTGHAARDGRRLRHVGGRRDPPQRPGHRQGRAAQRPRRLEAQDQGRAGHPGGGRVRGHAVPRAGHAAWRHGVDCGHLLPVSDAPARRAPPTRAGTSGSPATRRSSRRPCGWATWTRTRRCRVPTAASTALPCGPSSWPPPSRARSIPSFARVPWTFSKWDGKYAGKSPSPSASASPSKSPSPKPDADEDDHADREANAQAVADEDHAETDADGHQDEDGDAQAHGQPRGQDGSSRRDGADQHDRHGRERTCRSGGPLAGRAVRVLR